MRITPGYALTDKFEALVDMARRVSPRGLIETWGPTTHPGGQEFRLNYREQRVIGISPLANHVAVFMEWRRLYATRAAYANDADFTTFQSAHKHLTTDRHLHRPWSVWTDTDIADPQVETFLTVGMRLMVKDIERRKGASSQ
jgi:hypothetical protein